MSNISSNLRIFSVYSSHMHPLQERFEKSLAKIGLADCLETREISLKEEGKFQDPNWFVACFETVCFWNEKLNELPVGSIALIADVDIQVFDGFEEIFSELDSYDMCYQLDGDGSANGGFIAIKISPESLEFWSRVGKKFASYFEMTTCEAGMASPDRLDHKKALFEIPLAQQSISNSFIKESTISGLKIGGFNKDVVLSNRVIHPSLLPFVRVHHATGCTGCESKAEYLDLARASYEAYTNLSKTAYSDRPNRRLILISCLSENSVHPDYLDRFLQSIRNTEDLEWIIVSAEDLSSQLQESIDVKKTLLTHQGNISEMKNVALNHISESSCDGVVYFIDLNSYYEPTIFDEIRKTMFVSVFPVGNLGPNGIEGPIVRNSQIVAWDAGWKERKYPVSLSGFAFSSHLLKKDIDQFWPNKENGGETEFLEKLVGPCWPLETLCSDCTGCFVWHNHPI